MRTATNSGRIDESVQRSAGLVYVAWLAIFQSEADAFFSNSLIIHEEEANHYREGRMDM